MAIENRWGKGGCMRTGREEARAENSRSGIVNMDISQERRKGG